MLLFGNENDARYTVKIDNTSTEYNKVTITSVSIY